MLIVRSPVRISFGGGGTDLPAYFEQFGGAVLSTAINKYFYTILGSRSDQCIQIISSDLRICESWRDIAALEIHEGGLEIPIAVLKDLGREVCVDLFLASEIPPGTGLGSSASVCVNVLKTLTSYLHLPLSKPELAERAFHIARDVLSHHVGKQDEYAAAFGGLNFMEFQTDGSSRVQAVDPGPAVITDLQNSPCCFLPVPPITPGTSWTSRKNRRKNARKNRPQRCMRSRSSLTACAMPSKSAICPALPPCCTSLGWPRSEFPPRYRTDGLSPSTTWRAGGGRKAERARGRGEGDFFYCFASPSTR